MCSPPASTVGSAFMVATNVFYLVGAGVAVRRRHAHTAVLFGAVFVVSTLYHLCLAEFWCVAGAECTALRLLDNMVAHLLVADVVLFAAMFDRTLTLGGRLVHNTALAVAVGPAWLALANDMLTTGSLSATATVWLAGALAAALVLKLGLFDNGATPWWLYRGWYLLAAAALLLVGVVLFMADSPNAGLRGDLLHAAWHALGGLAPVLIFLAVPPAWECPLARRAPRNKKRPAALKAPPPPPPPKQIV